MTTAIQTLLWPMCRYMCIVLPRKTPIKSVQTEIETNNIIKLSKIILRSYIHNSIIILINELLIILKFFINKNVAILHTGTYHGIMILSEFKEIKNTNLILKYVWLLLL